MVIGLALAVSLTALAGCGRKNRDTRARLPDLVVRDIPTSLRGTIGAEARLRGVNATLASGIGFVVGLNGTGGLPLPEHVAGHLEREMALDGIGRAGSFQGSAIQGKSPRELLADRNTAAVLVQAAIPPGAIPGTGFDVYVQAINATSLEGGRLWTTRMRPGEAAAFGASQARVIAEAKGPIFINPFAEPGAEMDGVVRTVGRVLDGGKVTIPLQLEVILDNPSHARAKRIASTINSAFPERSGDQGPIARGRDDQLVSVRVPYRYRDDPKEFIELVRHLSVDQSYPELYARRYSTTLKNEPAMADDMAWCLQAIGERAKPFLADLYDYPEVLPRLAALRAGAGLGDARTAVHLIDIAENGPESLRVDAIGLMTELDAGPTVDRSLRMLLGEDQLTVRVAAYEALARRAELSRRRALIEQGAAAARQGAGAMSLRTLDRLSRASLPGGTIHGVSRRPVEKKFYLDRAVAGSPLIYVTQQAEPRIVLFGETVTLRRPLLVGAWSDRLMITSDSETDSIRLYYLNPDTGRAIIQEISPDVEELIEFMAHQPSPEDPRPGLGLSYSEVVGALYEIYRDGGLDAAFATERDRMLADLMAAQEDSEIAIRPETPGDETTLYVFDDPTLPIGGRPQPGLQRRTGLVVPLGEAAKGVGKESTDGGKSADSEAAAGRPEN